MLIPKAVLRLHHLFLVDGTDSKASYIKLSHYNSIKCTRTFHLSLPYLVQIIYLIYFKGSTDILVGLYKM